MVHTLAYSSDASKHTDLALVDRWSSTCCIHVHHIPRVAATDCRQRRQAQRMMQTGWTFCRGWASFWLQACWAIPASPWRCVLGTPSQEPPPHEPPSLSTAPAGWAALPRILSSHAEDTNFTCKRRDLCAISHRLHCCLRSGVRLVCERAVLAIWRFGHHH
jgi:hypothetical protein